MPHDSLRSRCWTGDEAPRYWWHRLSGTDYVPSIYGNLTEEEWRIIRDWFAETSRLELTGECAVPIMSLLQGFVLGSNVRRIVQLGTHSGYSTLLIGFLLRQMKATRGLCTFEIGEALCRFTRDWIEKARLTEFIHVEHRNSLDPLSTACAREYLGGAPELIFLDSSHEYGSTLAELDSWYPELAAGGLIVLHDSSEFAESFDVTKKGGVARALREWRQAHPGVETISLNHSVRAMETPQMVYKDFCGVGLIQKPV